MQYSNSLYYNQSNFQKLQLCLIIIEYKILLGYPITKRKRI